MLGWLWLILLLHLVLVLGLQRVVLLVGFRAAWLMGPCTASGCCILLVVSVLVGWLITIGGCAGVVWVRGFQRVSVPVCCGFVFGGGKGVVV